MRVGQTWNLTEIGHFLTHKTSILHFLALSAFFAVLMVVFGHPVSMLACTTQLSGMNPLLQVTLATAAGLVTLAVSRWLLYAASQRHSFSPMGHMIWLLVELIGIIAVMSLALWLVSGGGKLALAALAGDLLLYVIAIEALPYVISLLAFRLREEHAEVLRLREMLDDNSAAEGIAPSAATNRTVNFYDKGNKLVFSTMKENVLYIEAADNYVNIHYLNGDHEDTFILHNTLKELEQRLADVSMLRCHRGYMVNVDNVKLLRRDGANMLLELNGTAKVIPITKTYASAVTTRLANNDL